MAKKKPVRKPPTKAKPPKKGGKPYGSLEAGGGFLLAAGPTILVHRCADGIALGAPHARPCTLIGVHNSTGGALSIRCTLFGPGPASVTLPPGQATVNNFNFTVPILAGDVAAGDYLIQIELMQGLILPTVLSSTMISLNLT